jgi:predicted DCC family thiol-disulfide oxidoreductase YuxK
VTIRSRSEALADAFVNYFDEPVRPSPFNLAFARAVLGLYLIWRVASLEWASYGEWPFPLRSSSEFLWVEPLLSALPYLQWVLVGLLALFVVGYRIRWTAGLGGLLLAHMLSTKTTIYLAGTVESLFVCAYVLLLFAFFSEDDVLSVDGLRRTRNRSPDELATFLKSDGAGSFDDSDPAYRHRPLKWALLVAGLMYLGSAWGKIMRSPLDVWLSGEELRRDLLFFREVTGVARPLAEPFVQVPELAWAGFVATTAFQLGLLVAVLLGVTIAPFVVGLISFHLVVVATLGLYFIDMVLLLALFGAWDRVYGALAADRTVDLMYDERCYFCARSLYPFKLLDVNGTVGWYSQFDAPEAYRDRPDVDFEAEMYVFVDGEAHGGYHAFRQLLKQFPVTVPLWWLMALPPVAAVGERVYEYVAENRDRHFVCSYEGSEGG